MKKLWSIVILVVFAFGLIQVVHAQTNVGGSENSGTSSSAIRKCGVNTFMVTNDCGVGAFRYAYWQCYDGYEERREGQESCKPSEVWSKYAQQSCENRCGDLNIPNTPKPAEVSTKPAEIIKPAPTSVAVSPTAVPVCYISNNLLKEYDGLILELKKAESEGNEESVKGIIQKIIKLKAEIEKNREECSKPIAVDVENVPLPTVLPTIQSRPVIMQIDKCKYVESWEKKIEHYKKLSSLSDSELKRESGFSREEINKILSELSSGLQGLKQECENKDVLSPPLQAGGGNVVGGSGGAAGQLIPVTPSSAGGGGGMTTPTQPQVSTKPLTQIGLPTSPPNPVAVNSGNEIDLYYRAKLEKITSLENTDEQIKEMKELRGEIDNLIENLLKSRKEIEVAEIGGLVEEIKVSAGEIKASNTPIKTTDTRVLVDVGTKQLSVEPEENQVVITDGDIKVNAEQVFIRNNALTVGNSEVKLTPSEVVGKFKVVPKEIQLKEENAKAVYKIKAEENRKLLWFIPVKIEKDLTADAENGDILEEKTSWYSFLTTG